MEDSYLMTDFTKTLQAVEFVISPDPCGRTQWYFEDTGKPSGGTGRPGGKPAATQHYLATTPEELQRANLYSSLTKNGMHAPALDLDFPARLLPSSTKGHYHLYLDKEIYWEDYARLIQLLGEIGILEVGNALASLEKGMTCLRKPGIVKPK